MSNKHFLTTNNCWKKIFMAKLKPESRINFSGILVSKGLLLDMKLVRYKLPYYNRELGHWWDEV